MALRRLRTDSHCDNIQKEIILCRLAGETFLPERIHLYRRVLVQRKTGVGENGWHDTYTAALHHDSPLEVVHYRITLATLAAFLTMTRQSEY